MSIRNSLIGQLKNVVAGQAFTIVCDKHGPTGAIAAPYGLVGFTATVSTTPAGQSVTINGTTYQDGDSVAFGYTPQGGERQLADYLSKLTDFPEVFVADGVVATLSGIFYRVTDAPAESFPNALTLPGEPKPVLLGFASDWPVAAGAKQTFRSHTFIDGQYQPMPADTAQLAVYPILKQLEADNPVNFVTVIDGNCTNPQEWYFERLKLASELLGLRDRALGSSANETYILPVVIALGHQAAQSQATAEAFEAELEQIIELVFYALYGPPILVVRLEGDQPYKAEVLAAQQAAVNDLLSVDYVVKLVDMADLATEFATTGPKVNEDYSAIVAFSHPTPSHDSIAVDQAGYDDGIGHFALFAAGTSYTDDDTISGTGALEHFSVPVDHDTPAAVNFAGLTAETDYELGAVFVDQAGFQSVSKFSLRTLANLPPLDNILFETDFSDTAGTLVTAHTPATGSAMLMPSGTLEIQADGLTTKGTIPSIGAIAVTQETIAAPIVRTEISFKSITLNSYAAEHGAILRYQDNDNYIVVSVHSVYGAIRFRRRVNGALTNGWYFTGQRSVLELSPVTLIVEDDGKLMKARLLADGIDHRNSYPADNFAGGNRNSGVYLKIADFITNFKVSEQNQFSF